MSTNFYWRTAEPLTCGECPTCGGPITKTSLHVGKSSSGWRFLFRVYPDGEIQTVNDWEQHMHTRPGELVDEYGEVRDVGAFWTMVRLKQSDKSHREGWSDSPEWVTGHYDAVSCDFS